MSANDTSFSTLKPRVPSSPVNDNDDELPAIANPSLARRTSLQRPSNFQVSRLRSQNGRFPSFSSIDSFRTDRSFENRSQVSSRFGALSRNSSSANLQLAKEGSSSRVDLKALTESTNSLRWTPLPKISAKAFPSRAPSMQQQLSTNAERLHPAAGHLGQPTALAATGMICIGTAKGWVMVFDYAQSIKCICGNETILRESGAVTALAISSDRTFIAVGHARGVIHIYNLSKPSQPARSVFPTSLDLVQQGRAEGHLKESRIRHLAFVGTRHTAIVSSDDRGLAFYHSLGQVLGLANTDIVRIIGKYPESEDVPPLPLPDPSPNQSHLDTMLADAPVDDQAKGKLSGSPPIFHLATLPLGTIAHGTDGFCLVALVTSTKLLVAGLRPSPKTWWRALQKDALHHSPQLKGPVIGSLAWFPATKEQDPMLAFSWGSVVRIVNVRATLAAHSDVEGMGQSLISGKKQQDKILLSFVDKNLWSVEETIVKLTWLNEKILMVQTASHIDLWDTTTQRRSGRSPLDLRTVINPDSAIDGANSPSFSSVSASLLAAYNVRTYKNKVFVVALADVRVATVLTWADRIISLVNAGHLLEAIELTTLYYQGEANAVSLGLPADPAERHSMVASKLNEIMVASTEYVFSEDRMQDATHETEDGRGVDRTQLFEGLVDACARACIEMSSLAYLFEELYERFQESGIESIFLSRIEPFILGGQLRQVPPQLIQALLAQKDAAGETSDAETLIFNVDANALDIHQTLAFCERHQLYDALIYIYTTALMDYQGALMIMLRLISELTNNVNGTTDWNAETNGTTNDNASILEHSMRSQVRTDDAYRIYLFLASTFANATYPQQAPLSDPQAILGKSSICQTLFSFKAIPSPTSWASILHSSNTTYPYLALLLRFDAEATLDWLDQAFEDAFLDDFVTDRQEIVNTLLFVAAERHTVLSASDIDLIYMFIAHNVPKYPQYIGLDQKDFSYLLKSLIVSVDWSTKEDRQLSVEYLLSVWRPENMPEVFDMLQKAAFFRVQRMLYRAQNDFYGWTRAILQDADLGLEVFSQLDMMCSNLKTKSKQYAEIAKRLMQSVVDLVRLDVQATVRLVSRSFPAFHTDASEVLNAYTSLHYQYLDCLLKSEYKRALSPTCLEALQLVYLQLLCDQKPSQVIPFLESIDVQENMLQICKRSKAYDAAIWSLARNGEPGKALQRYDEAMQDCLDQLITQHGGDDSKWLHQLQQCTVAATNVCIAAGSRVERESCWSDLLSTILSVAHQAKAGKSSNSIEPTIAALIMNALSSLVSSASSQNLSFPKVFRRMISDTKFKSFSTLRSILGSMTEAYRFEGEMLDASLQLYQQATFQAFSDLQEARRVGWRPHSGICDLCKEPLYGTHALPSAITEEEQKQESVNKLFGDLVTDSRPLMRRKPSLKGKEVTWPDDRRLSFPNGHRIPDSSLVIFKSGIVMHQTCLQYKEDAGQETVVI